MRIGIQMVQQVRTVWSGFTGAPGYTNLFFADASVVDDILDAVTDFWTALAPVFTTQTSLAIDNFVQNVNTSTGEVVGGQNGTTFHPPVTGTGGGDQGPGPVGACIGWETAQFVDGHRLRGRTFLVPLQYGAFEGNGTLLGTHYATINTAAAALVTNSDAELVVWHRPTFGAGGIAGTVTATATRDKAAVLRSRRD